MRRLLLSLALVVVCTALLLAAVAVTNDTDKTPTTGTSIAYTSLVTSGTNPVFVLGIGLSSTTATISGVVCSAGLTCGTPVEVKAQRTASNFTYVSVWCVPAPTGTGTLTATVSASVPWQSNVILLAGADQTTPCPLADAGSAAAVTNPLSVTPANLTANDAGIGYCGNAINGDAPNFDQTDTFNDNTSDINFAGGYHLGTGAVSCTWGTPHADDVLVGIRVAAVGGAAAVVPQNMMLGVGP